MKKGTIFRNLWAGHETYFVYQGSLPPKGMQPGMSHGYGLMLHSDGKWRVDRSTYYTRDLKNDREHFPIVGHVDLDKAIADTILSAVGRVEK